MAADLDGRTFLVTGANTGIGRATAVALAARGGRVHLACRSEEKTRPVIEEIAAAGGPPAAFFALDLVGPRLRAGRGRRRSSSGGEQLDVLIDNAGVGGQRGLTTQGFELTFGVNHLGHFLFTTLLLDRCAARAPGAIVVVASDEHFKAKGIDWDALRRPTATYTGLPEYAVSKLCNVLFAQELARRLEGSGMTTYALHPGVIASDIYRRLPRPLEALAKLFMKSPAEGATDVVVVRNGPGRSPPRAAATTRSARPGRPSPVATPELGARAVGAQRGMDAP